MGYQIAFYTMKTDNKIKEKKKLYNVSCNFFTIYRSITFAQIKLKIIAVKIDQMINSYHTKRHNLVLFCAKN